jgi:phosphatidyl-myo-inositol dimannoside synthase
MSSRKILISSFDYPPRLGGVAKCSFELAKAFQDTQLEVRVLAPQNKNSVQSKLQEIWVKCSDRPEIAIFPLFLAKRRLYKEWKPDWVLDTLWLPDGIVSYLLSFFYPNIRRGIIIHGVEILESKSTWRKKVRSYLRFIKQRVLKSAHAIFPVSSFTKSLLEKEIGELEYREFQNGVNQSEYFYNESLEPSRIVFFTITRLENYKGIDRTLEALKILKDRGLDFMYRVAGEGPDRIRLENMIRSLDLSDRVTLLGKISHQQALEEYQKSSAFILVSRNDWETPNVEGFGLVYLEAALCGKPSLAPFVGGPTDAVVHGETGLLVNPEDPLLIAQSLETFFDREKTKNMGKKALLRAKEYSWIHSAEMIKKGFESCAE